MDKVRDVVQRPQQLAPFVQGAADLENYAHIFQAVKRLDDGSANDADLDLLRRFNAYQKADKTFGYQVANVLANLPAFFGELATTGGIYTAGKEGAEKGAKKLIEKYLGETGSKFLEHKLGQFAVKAGASMVGSALQTPVAGATRIAAETLHKMTPGVMADDSGKISIKPGTGEKLLPAFGKALTEQYIETASEHAGATVDFAGDALRASKTFQRLTKPVQDAAMKNALVRSIVKLNNGVSAQKVKAFLNTGAWNGTLGEMFEERVGDAMHGLANAVGLDDQKFQMPTPQQLAVELVSFSIPGIAGHMAAGVMDRVGGKSPRSRENGTDPLFQGGENQAEGLIPQVGAVVQTPGIAAMVEKVPLAENLLVGSRAEEKGARQAEELHPPGPESRTVPLERGTNIYPDGGIDRAQVAIKEAKTLADQFGVIYEKTAEGNHLFSDPVNGSSFHVPVEGFSPESLRSGYSDMLKAWAGSSKPNESEYASQKIEELNGTHPPGPESRIFDPESRTTTPGAIEARLPGSESVIARTGESVTPEQLARISTGGKFREFTTPAGAIFLKVNPDGTTEFLARIKGQGNGPVTRVIETVDGKKKNIKGGYKSNPATVSRLTGIPIGQDGRVKIVSSSEFRVSSSELKGSKDQIKRDLRPGKRSSTWAAVVRAHGGIKASADIAGEYRESVPLTAKRRDGHAIDMMVQKLRDSGYDVKDSRDLLDKLKSKEPVPDVTGTEKPVDDIASRRQTFQTEDIPAGRLNEGDWFTVQGEDFHVEDKTSGKVRVKDGVEMTLDEDEMVPVDGGEVKNLTTIRQPGAAREQIVEPGLLGQAKIPVGKIQPRGEVKPINEGLFSKEEKPSEQGDVFDDIMGGEKFQEKIPPIGSPRPTASLYERGTKQEFASPEWDAAVTDMLGKAIQGIEFVRDEGAYARKLADLKLRFPGRVSESPFGFFDTKSKKIYQNPRHLKDTPFHEAAHAVMEHIKLTAPALYRQGTELVRGSEYEKRAKAQGYKDPLDEGLVAAIGERGAALQTEAQRNRFLAWLKRVFERARIAWKRLTGQALTMDEFVTAFAMRMRRPGKFDITSPRAGEDARPPSKGDKNGAARMQVAETAGARAGEIEDARREWREKGTDSKYFRRWFGDSKVVDENGKPLVVYHGTDADFTEFKPSGYGMYFTIEPETAEHYAGIRARWSDLKNARVLPVYLSIKNPAPYELRNRYEQEARDNRVLKSTREYARDKLMSLGYDGIVLDGGSSFIAFSPTQIKSATGNSGTFDPENPDIRFQVDPTATPGAKRQPGSAAVRMQVEENAGAGPNEISDAKREWREKGTDSKYFRRWYNGPADENGQPIKVYHGTNDKFNKINMKKGAQGVFWFTSDKGSIEQGESGAQGTKNIMELYANISNPAGWEEYNNYYTDQLITMGYDGVILKEKDGSFNGFVFSPTQIKSATGNRGTFDPENPDIRFQEDIPPVGEADRPPSKGDISREDLEAAKGVVRMDYEPKEPDKFLLKASAVLLRRSGATSASSFVKYLTDMGVNSRLIEFANRSFGFVENELARQIEEEKKNASQIAGDILEGEVMPSIARRFMTVRLVTDSTVDTLRRVGGRMKTLADKISGAFDDEQKLAGQMSKPFRDLKRSMGGEAWEEAVGEVQGYLYLREKAVQLKMAGNAVEPEQLLAARGEAAQAKEELGENAKKLLATWDNVTEEVGKFSERLGTKAKNPKTGEWEPMQRMQEYWPRILRPEISRVLKDPTSNPKEYKRLLDVMMNESGLNEARARQFLRDNLQSFIKTARQGNLENRRVGWLPAEWYDYRFENILGKYVSEWSRRLAQIKHFGQEAGPNQHDIFHELVEGENAIVNEKLRDYVKSIRTNVYRLHENGGWEKFMRTGRTYMTVTKLTSVWTALRNLSSIFTFTTPEYGAGRSLASIGTVLTNWSKLVAETQDAGALRDDVMLGWADSRDIGEKERIITTKALRYTGFELTETFNRTHAAVTARAWARWGLKQEAESRGGKIFQMKLEKMGVDIEKLRAGERPQWDKLVRHAVNQTQFSYDLRQVPLWADTPVAKWLFQFQKFGLQATRYIAQDVIKPAVIGHNIDGVRYRDLRPLLLWAAMAAGSGELFFWLRDQLFNKKRNEPSWAEIKATQEDDKVGRAFTRSLERTFVDMIYTGGAGALGEWADFSRTAFTAPSRAKSPLQPPGLSPLNNLVNSVILPAIEQKKLTGTDLWNFIKGELPLLNYSSAAAVKAMAVAGIESDPVTVAKSKAEIGQVNRAWDRFLSENDLEHRQLGRMSKSPRTPLYRDLSEALLCGDVEEVNRILGKETEGMTHAEVKDAMKRIRSSVGQRDPLQFGEHSDSRAEFMKWLKRRNPDLMEKIYKIEMVYMETAMKTDLMKKAGKAVSNKKKIWEGVGR